MIGQVKGYIGITDGEWAAFLAAQGATEVNFWLPSSEVGFRALKPGEPFLFKSHHRDNRIIGGGYFEHYAVLRVSEAWSFLGIGNGAEDHSTIVERVSKYRRKHPEPDPYIGCVILNDVVFFNPSAAPPGPRSMAKSIVRGKVYDLPAEEDPEVQRAFELLFAASAGVSPAELPPMDLGPTYGDPRMVAQRLGQGGFRAAILDAYQARCAITGHKIRPTLQAAHIRPVATGGAHRVDNGLLLRSDVHTLFDRGYLTVDKDYQLRVSPRLREEFGNGEEFYSQDHERVLLPSSHSQRPKAEFLEWHGDEVFLAA
jgi:putative restriction endonuclease